MKVILAEHSGFCFGVKKAIDKAFDEIKLNKEGKPIYSLGPLIHNPQVVEQLAQSGVKVVENLDEIRDQGNIIIRSHGVSEEIYDAASKKAEKIINTTCPFVKRIQDIVKEHHEKGYCIVIIGNPNHPEVIGINGWCNNEGIIIQTEEDIERIPNNEMPLCVVVQTTMSIPHYHRLAKLLKDRGKEIKIFNTICHATQKRQDAVKRLAKKADAIIVVGGYHSSNTQKLVAICKEQKPDTTFHVETAQELDLHRLKQFNVVGVTAGASTPPWIIEEVVNRLNHLE
ncbi:4-hydroxy-3-methylbut-2-enyl diphosphate reductase [Alkaliphilus crotonatoxidans]